MGGDEVVLRHHLVDGTVQTALKAQVAVGDDTYQMALVIDNGDAADMVLGHDVKGLGDGRTATDGDRVIDHAVLGALDDGHLTGLVLYRHILVDDADTAFTGYGNSHLTLGHGVHGGRHKRHVQLDMTREACFQLYCLGQHFRVSGNQQDVVECQAVHHNLVCNK